MNRIENLPANAIPIVEFNQMKMTCCAATEDIISNFSFSICNVCGDVGVIISSDLIILACSVLLMR